MFSHEIRNFTLENQGIDELKMRQRLFNTTCKVCKGKYRCIGRMKIIVFGLLFMSEKPSHVVMIVYLLGTTSAMSTGSAPLIFEYPRAFGTLVSEAGRFELAKVFVEHFNEIVEVLPYGVIAWNLGFESFTTLPTLTEHDEITDVGLGTIEEIDAIGFAEFLRAKNEIFFSLR
jgi:hypothetical protein